MQTIKNQGPEVARFGEHRPGRLAAVLRPEIRVCLVLLLVLGGLVSGCRPPGPRALLKGKALLEKGKFEQAAAELRTATLLLKTNAIAFTYLGLALHQSGQLREAETAYQRALALDHQLTDARFDLGCLYLEENKLEQAKSELTAFTLRRPDSPEGWIQLGTAQLRSREGLAAERSFSQALRLKPPDPECLSGIGLAKVQRNHPVEAVQWFRNALKVQPDYAPALLNLAIIAQEQLRDKPMALQYYRLYLARKPAPEDSAPVARLVQQLEQQLAPAAPALAASSPGSQQKSGDSPVVKTSLVPAAQATNSVASRPTPSPTIERVAATTKTQATVAAKSQMPTTNEARPQGLTTAPKPAETVAQPKAGPVRTSAPALPLEAVKVSEDQVFKAAEDTPLQAPSAATTPTASAVTQKSQPSQPTPGPTAKPLKRGFLSKINPARIFSGDENAAPTTALQSNVQRSSSEATDSVVPVRAQLASVSPAVARYQYLSPAKPKPGDRAEGERAYAQGVQAQRSHRTTEAIQAYQRATQLDPAFFDAYYNLGVVAAGAGDLRTALPAYEYALAINSSGLDARYNFALALKQASYPVDARNELEKLLAQYPNETRAHLALGNLYAQQFHEPGKAREHYLKVLASDPQNSQAGAIHYWLTDNPPH